jgi:hypothetical protein
MSKQARLRKRVNYETDIPRCENCSHYRKPGKYLIDSLPRTSPPQCKLHEFVVRPNACCDYWRGLKGEGLA